MTVPAKAEMPRIAYTACNGTEDEDVFSQQNLPRNARWGHLNGLHRTQPFHLLLHGGDQLYADALWKECPSLKAWDALPARDAHRGAFHSRHGERGGSLLLRSLLPAVESGRIGGAAVHRSLDHDVGRPRHLRRLGLPPRRSPHLPGLPGDLRDRAPQLLAVSTGLRAGRSGGLRLGCRGRHLHPGVPHRRSWHLHCPTSGPSGRRRA